jgi:hypothetical protein
MKKSLLVTGILASCLLLGLAGCGNSTTQDKVQKANSTQTHKSKKVNKNQKKNNSLVKNEYLFHLLKMDPLSLKDEMKSGKSIVDVGKEKNVTEDQMVNTLIQQRISSMKAKGKTDAQIQEKQTIWEKQLRIQLEKVPNTQ